MKIAEKEKNYKIVTKQIELDYPLITDFNKSWVIPLKPVKNPITNLDEPEYKINCQMLAKYIKENIPYLFVREDARGSKLTYIYADGFYKLVNEEEFKGVIKSFIPFQLVRSVDVNEIYFDLSTEHIHIACEELNRDENYINFNNGLFNLNTWQLEKHSPKVYSTIRIPVNYKPIDECEYGKVFNYYIDFLTSNDKKIKDLLLECCGLIISNIYGYRTKKSLFLIGKHNSGKTQLKELLTEIIGRQNVCTTNLERLNAQFGTSDLYQKRLAGSNDLSYQPVREMVIFKQLTGGDSISVEFKGKGSFPYKFKGFLWFNSNAYPKFSGDKDKAVYERIIPVICDNVVPENKRDSKLLEKMLEEKEYIIALSLEHLKDLIKRNYRFDEPEEVIKARDTYETENNNLYMFVSTCCIVDSEVQISSRIKLKTFKKYYQLWSDSNNIVGKANDKDIRYYLEQKYGINVVKSNGYYYLDKLKFNEDFKNEYNVGSFSD